MSSLYSPDSEDSEDSGFSLFFRQAPPRSRSARLSCSEGGAGAGRGEALRRGSTEKARGRADENAESVSPRRFLEPLCWYPSRVIVSLVSFSYSLSLSLSLSLFSSLLFSFTVS